MSTDAFGAVGKAPKGEKKTRWGLERWGAQTTEGDGMGQFVEVKEGSLV